MVLHITRKLENPHIGSSTVNIYTKLDITQSVLFLVIQILN